MRTFKVEVWVRGIDLLVVDINAKSEKEAIEKAKSWYRNWSGKRRLPAGTTCCIVPPDYFHKIARMNAEAGFNGVTDF